MPNAQCLITSRKKAQKTEARVVLFFLNKKGWKDKKVKA